ncbi:MULTISPECIES: hypothetical protein [unclassified Delftia]|uniref:hypothetical protein n=1 Tax=unclassified Delftia TaxID=2613839 RepID=UPI00117762F0|nr:MULTISPECIES: hypothetical protein [unclassified Delftia]
MKIVFSIDFLWVPSDFGGSSFGPCDGIRMTVRWQKYISAYLECSNDAEIELISYNEETFRGKARCKMYSEIDAEWLSRGQLIELISGYRVFAIGKIAENTDC